MITGRRAIFTICSNNYVPMARVLLESAKRHHPEADVYLCLADEALPEAAFYPGRCELVVAETLSIPGFREFAFRYDIMEFNTAIKPFMIRHLLARGYEAVVYLDPDIEIFAPLERVFSLLDDGASFVLTPHLTQPLEQPDFPNDLGIMRAGIYNLGFLGVGAGEDADRILRWWSRRLQYECVNEQDRGIFVDQKFMDLVPGFTDGARILRDTAYNVAYWNLQQRTLGGTPGDWKIDGEPLRFFHFSGITPSDLRRLSKHTESFRDAEQPPQLGELLRHYAAQVLANGHGRVPDATYAYGRFASGTALPSVVRRMFRDRHVHWFGGDPFRTYEEYLHLPCARTHGITNLMAYLHEREPWLRGTYDLATNEGVGCYIDWYIQNGRTILKDSRLVAPVALRAGARASRGGGRRLPPRRGAEPDAAVVGYLRLALGVGEAGRQVLRTLRHAGLETRGLPIQLNSMSAAVDKSLEPLLDDTATARVQVFNVNADQLPAVIAHLGSALRSDAYRVVMPFWELEHFPQPWLAAFDLVDEVWAPTRFIQTMLARRISKPVLHVPLPLDFEAPPPLDRARFGLPEHAFLFFFSFDFLSYAERKNPMALVRAFKKAFREGDTHPNVCLVLKTLNADIVPTHGQALRDALRADPDLTLIEETLTRTETLQLIGACDAVVSLHRSEGLGLLIAEAMALGKPVIATDYSATAELVSANTGWPVDFKLVPVPENHYPFHEGQVWAEPDENHAAWQMRQVFHNPREAQCRADAARAMLRQQFGAENCGARMRLRIEELESASLPLTTPPMARAAVEDYAA
jgi:glycosyltransferase involved in cell wall biosynthesis